MNVVTPDPAGNEMIASVVTRGKHIIRQETNPHHRKLKVVNIPIGSSQNYIEGLLGPNVQSLQVQRHSKGVRAYATFANIDDRNNAAARINKTDSPYILVESVEPNWTEDQLKLFFGRYGDVEKVMLRIHDVRGNQTGLVIFRSEEEAVHAYDQVIKIKTPFYVLAVVTNNRVQGHQQPPQAPQGHQRPPRPQQRPQAAQRYQQPPQQPQGYQQPPRQPQRLHAPQGYQQPPQQLQRPHAPHGHQQLQRQPQRLQGYPVVQQRLPVHAVPVPVPVQQPQLVYPGQYQQYPGMGAAFQVPPGYGIPYPPMPVSQNIGGVPTFLPNPPIHWAQNIGGVPAILPNPPMHVSQNIDAVPNIGNQQVQVPPGAVTKLVLYIPPTYTDVQLSTAFDERYGGVLRAEVIYNAGYSTGIGKIVFASQDDADLAVRNPMEVFLYKFDSSRVTCPHHLKLADIDYDTSTLNMISGVCRPPDCDCADLT